MSTWMFLLASIIRMVTTCIVKQHITASSDVELFLRHYSLIFTLFLKTLQDFTKITAYKFQ